MVIYKPTGQKFRNRKEARIALGSAFYNRLEKEGVDLVFMDNSQFATNGNAVYTDPQKVSGNG